MAERRVRRKYTPREKMQIVLEGMRGDQAVADVCRKHGINPTLYYTWKDKVIAAAEEVFKNGNTKPDYELEQLRQEHQRMKDALTEVVTENLELKKTRWGLGTTHRR